MYRRIGMVLCLFVLAVAVWLGNRGGADSKSATGWQEVLPGVWRSPGQPAGYALVTKRRALLIDAPRGPEGLMPRHADHIDGVLLSHAHRDTVAAAGTYLARKVPVRAPEASAPWLTPESVTKYWREAIPLRNSRTAHLVVAEGLAGIDCSLKDGATLDHGDWSIRVVAAPGHSPDHMAFLVRQKTGGKSLLFAGDALAAPGKLWSPWTTDWDHWTDAGLKPTAATLRAFAGLRPDILLPARGEVIGSALKSGVVRRALEKTASAVDEVAFLKSYERFTRNRLKDPPKYAFLAKEQAGSNGSKPWSRLSKSLWLTGNTYVLQSRDGPCLVVDPWDPNSAKQIPKLQKEQTIGPVEVVLASHAHYDHYDGAYTLFERDRPKVWTLDQVATPIADPYLLRAPFLDARPLTVHRRARDREVLRWREFSFRFHFLPGQSLFTMGVETTIDGKKCLFTADNFFHHDLYSGTGGWMGLNRSGPLLYASSARKVLEIAPEWVLAEHGSAMEFNADDFRRRIQWGETGARAADAVSVSGRYRHDWNPHHVRIEPVRLLGKPGQTLSAELVIDNVLSGPRTLHVALDGRERVNSQRWTVETAAGRTTRRPFQLTLGKKLASGRYAFPLEVRDGDVVEPGDAFVVVDVEEKAP